MEPVVTQQFATTTVPRIILPLQNVDTVICNGLFAHLAVFSRHIKETTRVASRFAYLLGRRNFVALHRLIRNGDTQREYETSLDSALQCHSDQPYNINCGQVAQK
jgi:hypothetical protein